MRIINAQGKNKDLRSGQNTKQARGCRTPYGTFRSVAVARDTIMTKHPLFWMDLIGTSENLGVQDIAARVYRRVWDRCSTESNGWQFL